MDPLIGSLAAIAIFVVAIAVSQLLGAVLGRRLRESHAAEGLGEGAKHLAHDEAMSGLRSATSDRSVSVGSTTAMAAGIGESPTSPLEVLLALPSKISQRHAGALRLAKRLEGFLQTQPDVLVARVVVDDGLGIERVQLLIRESADPEAAIDSVVDRVQEHWKITVPREAVTVSGPPASAREAKDSERRENLRGSNGLATRWQRGVKRTIDIVVSSLALVASAPVVAACGLAIWLQDRGPILYRQARVSPSGDIFALYKFRTMRIDADQFLRTRMRELSTDDAKLFMLTADPRVTPVGRFLRRTGLDEIPQLFNVLEGSMSLVGPRPALPSDEESASTSSRIMLNLKPGVTGLWQVEDRDYRSYDLSHRYDILYVKHRSIGLDLAILARTVFLVFSRAVRPGIDSRRVSSPESPRAW